VRRKTVVFVVLVLLCFGFLYVYISPEENDKYKSDLEGVIKKGHWFAWLLFIGNKDWLIKQFDFSEDVKEKLKAADIRQEFSVDISEKYKAQGGKYEHALISVLYKEPKNIELVALERLRNDNQHVAMTFAVNDSPNLPDKGRMLYSVVFRYYNPGNKTSWEKALRKIANAVPLCSAFGTAGKWIVVAYSYTYDQSDFATWWLREGDVFRAQKEKENEIFYKRWMSQRGGRTFGDDIRDLLAIDTLWASDWVKKHPEHIDERLYEVVKRTREELGYRER
jgi:hypothetical protein